jgi:hypothetical protein
MVPRITVPHGICAKLCMTLGACRGQYGPVGCDSQCFAATSAISIRTTLISGPRLAVAPIGNAGGIGSLEILFLLFESFTGPRMNVL